MGIKETVQKVERFAQELNTPVNPIRYSFETELRQAFERQAREELGGLDYKSNDLDKALNECDTVDDFKKAIQAHVSAFAGSAEALRRKELFQALRLDTEKLLGHWGYDALSKALKGQDVKAVTLEALNKKGLLLNTGGSNYQQRNALYKLAQLMEKAEPAVDAQKVWEHMCNAKPNEAVFPLGQVTTFKNGKITVKRLPAATLEAIAQGLADALEAYNKNNREA